MKSDQQPTDYSKPVAYDAEGHPLYAHPPVIDQAVREAITQTVHVIRPSEPEEVKISEAVKQKHDRSKKLYPGLNLSEGEFVIESVKRHLIGLFMPFSVGVLLLILSFTALINIDLLTTALPETDTNLIASFLIVFIFLILIGIYVSWYVFTSNRFYLTNESIIQEIQSSIFSKREQTVSLADIEDVSYTQIGIIEQIFNFGSIRLSTEGDETTYQFSLVADPKGATAKLNNAVEAFKNGRPVL